MSALSLYKQIAIKRIIMWSESGRCRDDSPIFKCMNTAKKYQLENYIIKSVCDGSYISVPLWKNIVKMKVNIYERIQCVLTNALYAKSSMYVDCIPAGRIWPWYVHASRHPELFKKCLSLMRAILGFENENANYGHVNYCDCKYDQVKTIPYILFECEKLHEKREMMLEVVEQNAPAGFIIDFTNLNSSEKNCPCAKWFKWKLR